MKVNYDKEVDVLRIILSERQIVESDESRPDVILDYDVEGNVVGMEILNASKHADGAQAREDGEPFGFALNKVKGDWVGALWAAKEQLPNTCEFAVASWTCLNEASIPLSGIRVIEERQDTKIGCIEEVAYYSKFITKAQLLELAEKYAKSGYGDYLRRVAG